VPQETRASRYSAFLLLCLSAPCLGGRLTSTAPPAAAPLNPRNTTHPPARARAVPEIARAARAQHPQMSWSRCILTGSGFLERAHGCMFFSCCPNLAVEQSMLSQEALLTPLKLRESHYTRLLSEHAAQVRLVVHTLSSACSALLMICAGTHCRGGN